MRSDAAQQAAAPPIVRKVGFRQLTHLLSPAGPLLLATADKACKRWSVGAVLEGYAFDDIHTLQLRSRPRVSAVSCRAAESFAGIGV